MTKKDVWNNLIELLSRLGVIGITTENFEKLSSDDIRDYIEDSLQFVNFIVSIEKIFKIYLPESFLFADFTITFDVLVDYILDNIK